MHSLQYCAQSFSVDRVNLAGFLLEEAVTVVHTLDELFEAGKHGLPQSLTLSRAVQLQENSEMGNDSRIQRLASLRAVRHDMKEGETHPGRPNPVSFPSTATAGHEDWGNLCLANMIDTERSLFIC